MCEFGKCANGAHSQGSNLPQTWPIKIFMISMNLSHSRKSIDTKIIIYYTFLVKKEFLKTKKDEIHHKKILSLPRSVIYYKFDVIRFPRMCGIY
jgi:hypothetical protein